jgi:hypothetical protein
MRFPRSISIPWSNRVITLRMPNLEADQKELLPKASNHSPPDVEITEFGTLQMSLGDPFGNRLTFYTNFLEERT